MNLQPTFAHYFPDGVEGPGTGALAGQCAVFCEYFVTMPSVGDTLQTKIDAVNAYGIPKSKMTSILPGDVLVFNIGAVGHLAVVNNNVNLLTLSESNYNLDLKVHHTRQIQPNDGTIIGMFRGALKVPVIISPMNIKLQILNNDAVDTLKAEEYQDIAATLNAWSGGRLQVAISSLDTHFQDIPFDLVGTAIADSENPNGLATNAIDFAWMRQNPCQLAQGFDVMQFWLSDADWKGNVNGVEHSDAGVLPAFCECHEQDATEALNMQSTGHTEAFWLAVHELRHALCAIGGLNDDTHAWLAKGATGLQQGYAIANLDYDTIEAKLAVLQKEQPAPVPIIFPTPANFPNWATDEWKPGAKDAIVANASGAHNVIIQGYFVATLP